MTREEIFEKVSSEKIDHHLVTVFNWEDFEKWCETENSAWDAFGNKIAIIEIYTSPGKPVLPDYIQRMFPTSIIALDFEDYPEDVDFPKSSYHPLNPTINYQQAEELVRFIDWNVKLGNDFIIHCGAGVSRSQQVAEFILMYTHHMSYVYDTEGSSHDHYFFHTIVLSRLLEVKHKIFPDFENKDDSFIYDEELKRWVPKPELES